MPITHYYIPESMQESEDQKLDATISYFLIHLGVRYHMRGFRYFKYAIKLVYQNPTEYEYMTKALYPAVAKYFDTKPSAIERSMRYAINSMLATSEIREEVFSGPARVYTNKEFIYGIVDAIERSKE